MTGIEQDGDEVREFWDVARVKARLNDLEVYTGVTGLGALQPPAWAFGATAAQADALLALVLAGTKTATAGALWDYEAVDEEVPRVGDLAIILDGAARPRALIGLTTVDIVPFDQVSAEHARAEGEGDRSLTAWRGIHRSFFTEHADHDRGFAEDMPVVCQTFRLLYPTPRNA